MAILIPYPLGKRWQFGYNKFNLDCLSGLGWTFVEKVLLIPLGSIKLDTLWHMPP